MAGFFSRPQPSAQPRIDMARLQAAIAPLPTSVSEAANRNYERATPRLDSWCVCSIKLDTGETRECVLIDLSETGGRVRFRTRGALTGIVRLKASRYRINRRARIVWKDMYDAGLEFIDVVPVTG